MIRLQALDVHTASEAAAWRNAVPHTLRTPRLSTRETQVAWFEDLQRPTSPHRYWKIVFEPDANPVTLSPHPPSDETGEVPAVPGSVTFDIDDLKRYARAFEREALTRTVGIGGLTYISWENRSAEIALLIAPSQWGHGYGTLAVHELVRAGFNRLNLDVIYGEAYTCGKNVDFWRKALRAYAPEWTMLPDRKYWEGRQCASHYFSLRRWALRGTRTIGDDTPREAAVKRLRAYLLSETHEAMPEGMQASVYAELQATKLVAMVLDAPLGEAPPTPETTSDAALLEGLRDRLDTLERRFSLIRDDCMKGYGKGGGS